MQYSSYFKDFFQNITDQKNFLFLQPKIYIVQLMILKNII